MNIASNITHLIGNTPMVYLQRLLADTQAQATVAAKLEFFNPASSVKDRIGLALIDDAIERGELQADSVIVEPTSGNTGIALAYVAAVKGLRVILTMPESMSLERRAILQSLGAQLVLTPRELGMRGAVEKAHELTATTPKAVMLHQFNNRANPQIHYRTTAREIWNDTEGKIDIFVAGVGTGGTLTGVGQFLKQQNSSVQIVAVEPKESSVLSGEKPAPHGIQGIGAGFVPQVLDRTVIDQIVRVPSVQAIETARKLMRTEGILAGISSGAAAWAATELANLPQNAGKLIVCLFPDTAERYLSTDLFKF